MQPLSPVPIQGPISMLEKMPALLELLLRDVPGEALEWKPAAERWSIAEVLGHLVMIEKLYGQRARRIVLETRQLCRNMTPGLKKMPRRNPDGTPNSASSRCRKCCTNLPIMTWGTYGRLPRLYRAYSFYPHVRTISEVL